MIAGIVSFFFQRGGDSTDDILSNRLRNHARRKTDRALYKAGIISDPDLGDDPMWCESCGTLRRAQHIHIPGITKGNERDPLG